MLVAESSKASHTKDCRSVSLHLVSKLQRATLPQRNGLGSQAAWPAPCFLAQELLVSPVLY